MSPSTTLSLRLSNTVKRLEIGIANPKHNLSQSLHVKHSIAVTSDLVWGDDTRNPISKTSDHPGGETLLADTSSRAMGADCHHITSSITAGCHTKYICYLPQKQAWLATWCLCMLVGVHTAVHKINHYILTLLPKAEVYWKWPWLPREDGNRCSGLNGNSWNYPAIFFFSERALPPSFLSAVVVAGQAEEGWSMLLTVWTIWD